MIFSEFIFCLKAENDGEILRDHGALVQGAFYSLLRSADAVLAGQIHDMDGIKPYSVSWLHFEKTPAISKRSKLFYYVRKGTRCLLRIVLFHTGLINCFASLDEGFEVQMGHLKFRADGRSIHTFEEGDFISGCLPLAVNDTMQIEFVTPVSLQHNSEECLFPAPEILFASIADKWNAFDMETPIDKTQVIEIAERIRLTGFSGKTRPVFVRKNVGVNCITGTYRYSLEHLIVEERELIAVLAQFSSFSGIGRMTGFGLGNVTVWFTGKEGKS